MVETIFDFFDLDDHSKDSSMTAICIHITEIWENGTYSGIGQGYGCDDDCTVEDIEMISFYDYMCDGCLRDPDSDSTCENWLDKGDYCRDYIQSECETSPDCDWDGSECHEIYSNCYDNSSSFDPKWSLILWFMIDIINNY